MFLLGTTSVPETIATQVAETINPTSGQVAEDPFALLKNLGFIAVFIGIMYFLMIRPQKKREKEAREMINTMEIGSKIVTIGGIVGEIAEISEDEVTILTGTDKIRMVFVKEAIKLVQKPEDK